MIVKIIWVLVLLFSLYTNSYAGTVSRTTGVAPLSVHFSADLTESTQVVHPFHDYEYSWDFGDPASGTWGTSNKSKNFDKGPVAAHVYDMPGTYNVTLTVRNDSGVIDSATYTITVTDPETVYAGAKTTCISTTSDFTGCPSGAVQVITDNLTVLPSYIATGKRVLLRRGSSWNLTSNLSWPWSAGPIHVGAFGDGINPDALGLYSNAPTINITGGTQFLTLTSRPDWRLTDISFIAPAGVSSVIAGASGRKDMLIYKIRSVGFLNGISTGTNRVSDESIEDTNSIISSHISGAGVNNIYIGSERLVLMGNIVENTNESHTCRVYQAHQAVISHNVFGGTSLISGSGRHALKIHGPSPKYYCLPNQDYFTSEACVAAGGTWTENVISGAKVGTFAETGSSGMRTFSNFAVVSNNIFGTSGPQPVAIGPQNTVIPERISNVLFEKNRIVADYGQQSSSLVTNPIHINGRYITIRNNIMDGSGGSTAGFTGISVYRAGAEWTPLGNRIYNNTIYSPVSLGFFRAIVVGENSNDTIVKNNYAYAPNVYKEKTLVGDASGNAISSNNVNATVSPFNNPTNTSPLERDFTLLSSATEGINTGAVVPVFDDFAGNARNYHNDIGAYKFGTPTSLPRKHLRIKADGKFLQSEP